MNTEDKLKDGNVYISEALKYLLARLREEKNQDTINSIGSAIFNGASQANQEHDKGTFRQQQVLDEFIKVLNEDIADNPHSSKITCTKGCSFCCHIKVDVSYYEAKYIYDYCLANNITINWDYLTAQSSMNDDKQWILEKHLRTCEFLKNNECSIYEARPMSCRKHYSIDDPQKCDTDKPYTTLAKLSLLNSEIFTAALWNSKIPAGTLSQMLLKVKEDYENNRNSL